VTDSQGDDGLRKPDEPPLRETPLTERHRALGARLIPFAGWLMPVQYRGILYEHHAVRSAAGLFDLGHMGQVEVSGQDALRFLQWVASNDVSRLAPGEAQYALLTNEQGGIVDDIIIYRDPAGDRYMVVVNASNRDKDVAWLERQRAEAGFDAVAIVDLSDRTGMIAVQGPRAEAVVRTLTNADLSAIRPFSWAPADVAGGPAMVARTGYTGEDGFELYVPTEHVGDIWDALIEAGRPFGLEPVGLGARDTLRLEARMPLYGNEMDDSVNPLEAGLGWAVALDKTPFVGRDAIARMKDSGPPRRTVGFRLLERSGSARHGHHVVVDGRVVGHVTSGVLSPTLGQNIGLALVEREVAGIGKPLGIEIRGKVVPAEQVRLPFYRRRRADQDGT
jgi:aminomethyltransferase